VWAVAAVCVAALAALVLRLFHSVDVTDEAFYAASAYRFALAARPLLDDWSPQQLAALLTSPIVRLHLALVGDTTGLMLTLRFAYLAMMSAAGAVMWAALRRVVRPWIALLAVVASIVLVPFTIPAPSYNTIAIAGVMVGCAGGIGVLTRKDGRPWAAVSGFGFALAAVAYTTVAVAGVVALVWLTWRRRERILPFVGGALLVAVPLAVVLVPCLGGLRQTLAYSLAMAGYGGNAPKLLRIASAAAAFLIRQPAFYATAACTAWAIARRRAVPRWVPLALSALAMIVIGVPTTTAALFAAAMMLTTSLVWARWRSATDGEGDDRDRERVARWVVGIGFAAGAIFAYTSTNGFMMLGAGGIAVMPALLALAAERFATSPRRASVAVAVLALVAAAGLLPLWTVAFRDASPLEQTARVASGPYAGMLTTPSTAASVTQMRADLRAVVRPGDRLLSYDAMPAPYLMTDAMPAAPMLWTAPVESRDPQANRVFMSYLQQPGHAPTVAVRNDRLALADSGYYTGALVDRYVQTSMALVYLRDEYRVFAAR
jgi:hypothetical protein